MIFHLVFLGFLLGFLSFGQTFNIRLTNNCKSTIWPAWKGGDDTPHGGGTTLKPDQRVDFEFPEDWRGLGALWARTGCDDNFNCETGSCGNSEKCNGKNAEFGPTGAVFIADKYFVSTARGFNIPIQIKPSNGTGDCKTIGNCNTDILAECPQELRRIRNRRTVECLGACKALKKDEYCCTGAYDSLEKSFNVRLTNECKSTIWPAWMGTLDTPHGGGTTLRPGQQVDFEFSEQWFEQGAIWTRTGCDDNFNCETGSCGNHEKCNGKDTEFGPTGVLFINNRYFVGTTRGFNIPIQIKPSNGTGDCKTIGKCNTDILAECPQELRRDFNGHTVECLSACTVFRKDEYCCTGAYSHDGSCKPTKYSKFFKDRCPTTTTYAEDKKDSSTCLGADYEVIFC